MVCPSTGGDGASITDVTLIRIIPVAVAPAPSSARISNESIPQKLESGVYDVTPMVAS